MGIVAFLHNMALLVCYYWKHSHVCLDVIIVYCILEEEHTRIPLFKKQTAVFTLYTCERSIMSHLYCFDPLLVSLSSALAIEKNSILSLQKEILGINELLQQKMQDMYEAQNNYFLLQDKIKECDVITQNNWKNFIGKYKTDPLDGCLFDSLPDNVIERIAMYANIDCHSSHRVCKRWHKAFAHSYQDIFQNWIERTRWTHVKWNSGTHSCSRSDPRELYHLMKKAESKCRKWEKNESAVVRDPHYYPLTLCYNEGRLLTMGRDETTKAELKLWDAEQGRMLSISS